MDAYLDSIPLFIFGILLLVLGWFNYKGNISSIHWYNRRRVLPEDVPAFGRLMGIGTIIIGASLMLTASLGLVFHSEAVYAVILAGAVIGIGFMVYAMLKYNHGFF